MTAPTIRATPKIALDQRAASRHDKAGEPFSVPAAVRYLDNNPKLAAEQRTAAFAYIRSAPSSVRTPVRDAVAAKWWPNVT